MNEQAVRATLRSFVLDHFLPGEDPDTLADRTLLVTSGVITSLTLLELVTFIEKTFDLSLQADDLGTERMDSIERMVALVMERAGKDPDGVRSGA